MDGRRRAGTGGRSGGPFSTRAESWIVDRDGHGIVLHFGSEE